MSQNEAQTVNNGNPFLQNHPALIRIWHWLTFILITLSIVTVLLNATLLNPSRNAKPVQAQLKDQGITIDDRQAFFLAHHFDDQLWDLHKYLGISIALLLLFRIAGELTLPAGERATAKMKSALARYREDKENRDLYRHYLAVRITYSLFYLLIIIMAVTGLMLAFGRNLGISRELNHSIKEFHGACQWAVYAFVLIHISGVISADLGKAKGVVSGMINGNK